MAESNLTVDYINESYNEEIIDIIKNSPIHNGALTLCFDRSPDFFLLPKIGYEKAIYAGLFRENSLEGLAGLCYTTGNVNGRFESIGYYSSLYVKKESRGSGFFYNSADYLFKEPYKNARVGFAIVMKGNQNATKLINKRPEKFGYLAHNKIIDELVVKNILITTPVKKSKTFIIERATETDVEEIVRLWNKQNANRIFAPKTDVISFMTRIARRPKLELNDFYIAKKNGELVGVCGAWETSAIKQTRILNFHGKMKLVRLLYGIFQPLLGLPKFPKKGGTLKEVNICDFAVKDNEVIVMEALLRSIYNDYRKRDFNSIIFGSYNNDPLLKAASAPFHTTTIKSHIILGSTSKEFLDQVDTASPFIEVALL